MTVSLGDLLTAQKNGVVAINNVSQATLRGQGTATSATVTGSTIIFSGKGYLVKYTVVVAGSASGLINNASSTVAPAASNALCATPNTVGIYPVGMVFTNGLTIVPGTGQSINVTYTPG
jgi:hypothetical protein